jgi:hypothetical protein
VSAASICVRLPTCSSSERAFSSCH